MKAYSAWLAIPSILPTEPQRNVAGVLNAQRFGEFIGGDTREEAQVAYDKIIRDYEKSKHLDRAADSKNRSWQDYGHHRRSEARS